MYPTDGQDLSAIVGREGEGRWPREQRFNASKYAAWQRNDIYFRRQDEERAQRRSINRFASVAAERSYFGPRSINEGGKDNGVAAPGQMLVGLVNARGWPRSIIRFCTRASRNARRAPPVPTVSATTTAPLQFFRARY